MRAKRKQFRVKVEKYTVNQFHAQFPDDAACLADIYRRRYPNGLTCDCGRTDKFTPIAGRRAYSCICGFQVYPTAGSIFHKSTTPLKTWYLAMSTCKPARTAWRPLNYSARLASPTKPLGA